MDYGSSDEGLLFQNFIDERNEGNENENPTERLMEEMREQNESNNSLAEMLSENEDYVEGTLAEVVEKYSNTNSENNSTSTKTNTNTNTSLKKSNTSSKIFNITKEPKEKKEEPPKLLGKKRQNENHTKFAFDNLVRKIKSKLFGGILIILNKSLETEPKPTSPREDQKEKKGEMKRECFLKPDQKIILQTNVEENRKLLKSKLRDIFSEKVSTKAKNYSKDHHLDYNKNFIEKIKNDEKKKKTNDILDMTFLQCMEHFRGSKTYEALNGLEEEYEKVLEEIGEDPDYKESFIEQLKYFEVLYENKKARNGKKKKV